MGLQSPILSIFGCWNIRISTSSRPYHREKWRSRAKKLFGVGWAPEGALREIWASQTCWESPGGRLNTQGGFRIEILEIYKGIVHFYKGKIQISDQADRGRQEAPRANYHFFIFIIIHTNPLACPGTNNFLMSALVDVLVFTLMNVLVSALMNCSYACWSFLKEK